MRCLSLFSVLLAAVLQIGCTGLSNSVQSDNASLENTYWKLIELRGEALPPSPTPQEPHIILKPPDNRVAGSGGCNRFFGTYETRDRTIGFSQLGSTRMACPKGMDLEMEFFQVLESATGYTVSGNILELFEDENRLARFEAINRE